MNARLLGLVVAGSLALTACTSDGGARSTEQEAATGPAPTTVGSDGPGGPVPGETAGDIADGGDDTEVDRPIRVLLAGDSLMQEISATVTAALGDGAESRFTLSPTLIRDEAGRLTWQSVLADFRPDLVVVMVSHWERLTLGVQRTIDFTDVEAYAGLVAYPFTRFIAEGGADLVWVAAPPLREQRVTQIYDLMNQAFRTATDAAEVPFVELEPVLTDGDGAFAEVLANPTGTLERVRNTDGIHFCPAGAIRVANAIMTVLDETAGLAAVPGWQNGAWRDEAPFDKPAECPAA